MSDPTFAGRDPVIVHDCIACFTAALTAAIRRMQRRPKRRAPLTIYDLDLVPRGMGGERG